MTDKEIYELFNYRCILCWHPATELNHIIPRSRSKSKIDDWKNKVPLCKSCHEKFHENGVTEAKMTAMHFRRAEILWTLGRQEYV